MAYFLISSFALLSLFTVFSLGLQVQRCDTCSSKDCIQPICKGGLVFDECDCCLVCAKVEGEKCGGAWGIYGSCEEGLYCHFDPNIGDALLEDDGNRAGICTATADASSREDCVQKLFSGCNIDTNACQCDDDVLACDNPFTYANFGLCQDAIWQMARAANGSPTGSIPPPALLKLFDSSEDTDCSSIKCVIVDIQCPNDSIIVTPPREPTECCDPTPTCYCDTSLCDDLICAGGYEKVLISAGDGQPGTCCDNFQCQLLTPSSDCSGVECPPRLPSLCPVNSRYVSGGLSEDGCCLLPNRCECALELCVPLSCDQGYELRLIAEGKDDPENCCPVYKCISKVVKGACVYPEISYEHGETWQAEPCQLCECRNGISHCEPIPGCEDSPTILKALCEVDGKLYANGDVWDQDDCTTCRCEDSKVQCTGASCSISCKNARKIPGVCCPVCDEPDVITIRPLKCGNFNCSLYCPLGFTRDIEGCPQCHCSQVLCPELESCELSCANGYAEDEQGCRICQCMPDPSKCQTINTCQKFCIYGFQKDRWGCPRCKCERCPNLVDCDLQCPNGFKKNDRGCNICRCADSPKPDTVLLTLGSCQSYSGKLYEDSESWHDGCRECYCHNGQEMCSLITCSVPACTSPVIRTGECCPTCPDSETNTITQINLKVCHSTEGHYYVEGEAWNIDMCTKCVCHDGHVLCSAETCPPLPCNHPSISENECCPHCPEMINIDGSGDSMPCELIDGLVYEYGSTWKENDCTSCKCEMGDVNCFSNTCPPATCKTPVLRKGQCCPTCLEEPVTNCEFAGALYSDGQHWTTDTCTICVCKQGISVCTLPDCPHLQCPDTVLLPGQCCPICQQGGGHQNSPTVMKPNLPGARTTRKTFSNARSQNPYKLFTHVPTRITIPESDPVPSSFPILPVILAILVILLALLIVIAMFVYVTKWRHRVDYQIKAKTLPTPPVTIMSIKKKNDNIKNSNRDSIRDSASFKDNKVQGNMYHDTKRNLDTIDMKRLSDYYGVGKSIQPV